MIWGGIGKLSIRHTWLGSMRRKPLNRANSTHLHRRYEIRKLVIRPMIALCVAPYLIKLKHLAASSCFSKPYWTITISGTGRLE